MKCTGKLARRATTRHLYACLATGLSHLTPGPTQAVRWSSTTIPGQRRPRDLKSHDTIQSLPDGSIATPELTNTRRMQIQEARKFFLRDYKFLYSAEALEHHPINDNEIPEIMVCGASNVGKSTLMNALLERSDAARVSAQPGKTTLMNAYGIGQPLAKPLSKASPRHGLILMDTPGYGFRSRASWGKNIVDYLEKRKALRGALVLMSVGKKLSEQDQWMIRQLATASVRTLVVLTKADKPKLQWEEKAAIQAQMVRKEIDFLQQSLGAKLQIDIQITSSSSCGQGLGGGIGGLRLAMLDMAGIAADAEGVHLANENVRYSGEVVSFDDIVYKV